MNSQSKSIACSKKEEALKNNTITNRTCQAPIVLSKYNLRKKEKKKNYSEDEEQLCQSNLAKTFINDNSNKENYQKSANRSNINKIVKDVSKSDPSRNTFKTTTPLETSENFTKNSSKIPVINSGRFGTGSRTPESSRKAPKSEKLGRSKFNNCTKTPIEDSARNITVEKSLGMLVIKFTNPYIHIAYTLISNFNILLRKLMEANSFQVISYANLFLNFMTNIY